MGGYFYCLIFGCTYLYFACLEWLYFAPRPTYGWYRADSLYWSSSTQLLYDISGRGNHASTNGGGISLAEEIGYGATTGVRYLTGGTSSTVTWPTGSIPSAFTICSVTRYVVGGKRKRILAATDIDWYHGHHDSKRGVAFYGNLNTNGLSKGKNITDWLVICGKNGDSVPNNILVDGEAAGERVGGTGSAILSINVNLNEKNSNWAFRELMIWNTALSDTQMSSVSKSLISSLNNLVSCCMFCIVLNECLLTALVINLIF